MNAENISPDKNREFLNIITDSFNEFLRRATSRSTAKLKPLHGFIASDIAERLGDEYAVFSQGYGAGKEASIQGRYVGKRVDITIKKGGNTVAGIAVKFVMQNYSQNSVNYFENMLGETANIRCANYPYFQIFVIFDKLPYYNTNKEITHWESFTAHNVAKYNVLSKDNVDEYRHTPNKFLLYVVHLPDNDNLKTKNEYLSYYRTVRPVLTLSEKQYDEFGSVIIINDYNTFMEKVYHAIMAI